MENFLLGPRQRVAHRVGPSAERPPDQTGDVGRRYRLTSKGYFPTPSELTPDEALPTPAHPDSLDAHFWASSLPLS